ncbi:MAG: hypothetical protein Q9172_007616 [Xanthocarpia lactea]
MHQSQIHVQLPQADFCILYHSENLIPMPGSGSDTENVFPFHMTHSPIGLVFWDYDPDFPIPNYIINQIVGRATDKISAAIARNPAVENQPVSRMGRWTHPARKFDLYIIPKIPNMKYGHLYSVFALLEEWASVYETGQCEFDIWAWPGMSVQKKLGRGHFGKDMIGGLKAANRSETG